MNLKKERSNLLARSFNSGIISVTSEDALRSENLDECAFIRRMVRCPLRKALISFDRWQMCNFAGERRMQCFQAALHIAGAILVCLQFILFFLCSTLQCFSGRWGALACVSHLIRRRCTRGLCQMCVTSFSPTCVFLFFWIMGKGLLVSERNIPHQAVTAYLLGTCYKQTLVMF